ncbi:hypothetical protein COOONC_24073 [Cooperia oncophora]
MLAMRFFVAFAALSFRPHLDRKSVFRPPAFLRRSMLTSPSLDVVSNAVSTADFVKIKQWLLDFTSQLTLSDYDTQVGQ